MTKLRKSLTALTAACAISFGTVAATPTPAEAVCHSGIRCSMTYAKRIDASLQLGSRGKRVYFLKKTLNALGFYTVANTKFDSRTKIALKRYQWTRGIYPTGRVTPKTLKALRRGAKAIRNYPKPRAAKATRAVKFAKRQIGDPYRYGGTGPGSWDCSGLTQGSWKAAGVKIPRTSYSQMRGLKRVSPRSIKPGDIVIYYRGGHAAIYVGHNKVIHASRPGRPVSTTGLRSMPMSAVVRPAA